LAKNVFLKARIAGDIDAQIEQVLNRLGNPEPPLDLRVVREALKLDFGYYSARDAGLLQETVARLRVGAKQVVLRPSLLLDVVRKFDLRALYFPDQKRILLDKDQPQLKHRWHEAHEIGHSVLEWHVGAMLGDDDHTLIPACHEKIEAEANFAAARLLFLRDRFREDALSLQPGFRALTKLAERYGNTKTSTFWRAIEYWGGAVPIVGMITDHPHPSMRKSDFDSKNPCRHFIQSPAFGARFSNASEVAIFGSVAAYCGRQSGGKLGSDDIIIGDDNGDRHHFAFTSFHFHYQTLTLGVYQKPYIKLVRF